MSQAIQISHYTGRKYKTPRYPHSHYLRQPNQPFSSSPLSSPSSSPLSSSPLSSSPLSSPSPETSVMSIDGEFDERVDVLHSPPPPSSQIVTHDAVYSITVINVDLLQASAPPLSDSDDEIMQQEEAEVQAEVRAEVQAEVQAEVRGEVQAEVQAEVPAEKIEEDDNRCIICYEDFNGLMPLSMSHRNENQDQEHYNEEFEVECYTRKEINDFCQTCRYSVHHKCIDEYRASKINDAMNNILDGRHDDGSARINCIFSIKCLTCAREVEKIRISRNGDIHITKTQRQALENEYDQRRRQRERHQYEIQVQEILQNRMQRRRVRGQRCYYCKNKLCTMCFGILLVCTVSLILFGLIR